MSNLYAQLQAHPAHKIRFGDLNFSHILAALWAGARIHATGIETRGLHWSDRRYTKAGGGSFIKGMPTAPIWKILSNDVAAKAAVTGRSEDSKKITYNQYKQDLVVRSIRGQILNPLLRTDRWLSIGKIAERLRKVALSGNSKFYNMALNPVNVNYFTNWILQG